MRRRKIFYIPGLISLIALPGCLLLYTASNPNQLHALEVIWTDPKSLQEDSVYLSAYKQFPPERNYLEIILTGDSKSDKTKLAFSQVWLRENKEDAFNGIHYHFNNSSKYWAYVNALNILEQESSFRHLKFKKDIWVFTAPPPEEPIQNNNYFSCGSHLSMRVMNSNPTWFQLKHENITRSWKIMLPVVIAFILLLWFSLRFILKQQYTHPYALQDGAVSKKI